MNWALSAASAAIVPVAHAPWNPLKISQLAPPENSYPPALSFILLAIGSFIPMKPNDKVLVQISKIDPKELGNLKPEQLQQLKENMEKLQESLKKGG